MTVKHPLFISVALFLLLGGTAWPAEKDDGQNLKAGDRDPAFLVRVNETIGRAVSYVQGKQEFAGSWAYAHLGHGWNDGTTALALLALLKAGVNRNDSCIEKGFLYLRKRPFLKIYTTSLIIMAIEARWRRNRPQESIKGVSELAQQKPKVPKRDLEWMREAVKFLVDNREFCERAGPGAGLGARDGWSYPRKERNNYADHSNTQFALLGLQSAARCGVRTKAEVFQKALTHFLKYQEKAGPRVQRVRMLEDRKHGHVSYRTLTGAFDNARGWTYGSSQTPRWGTGQHVTETTGSMTAVGVASIIICLDQLGPRGVGKSQRSRAQRAVRDGLAWLDHHFTVKENPGHHEKGWFYYYLYGIERAAVLADRRHLGRHDWYREGAEELMSTQNGDGAWYDKTYCGPEPTACLALLFLTKATVPLRSKITGK